MALGSVIEYFSGTHTYRVRIGSGELSEVPRVCSDPGDNTILPVDTMVVLHDELGFWVIDGVLKQTPMYSREFNRISTSEAQNVGGENPQNAQSENASSYRGSGDPRDMLPNDWVRHSGDGNFMGVHAGGMNSMSSGPFAQVRTHATTNSVEVIAHEYRHISSMGDLEIVNDGGKTSLTWRAGSDQSTENGSNAQNWTLRVDAGAAGDLFRFRVTTPQGQTLSEMHISPEGKLSLVGTGGVDITSKDYREDVTGARVAVTEGAFTQEIGGAEARIVGGERTTQVTLNDTHSVGGGQALNVTGNQVLTIGGGLTQSIGASSRIDQVKGYLDLVLADPLKGGIPGNSLCLINYGGDVHIQPSATLGKAVIFGSMPGSVELGADAIPIPREDGSTTSQSIAPFSAMIFEQFNAMMSAFLTWADTHVHPTAVGPSATALPPAQPIVNPLLPPIQSLRVKIGG